MATVASAIFLSRFAVCGIAVVLRDFEPALSGLALVSRDSVRVAFVADFESEPCGLARFFRICICMMHPLRTSQYRRIKTHRRIGLQRLLTLKDGR